MGMTSSGSAHNRQGLLFLLTAAGISCACIAYFALMRGEIDLGELEGGAADSEAESLLTEEERAAPWQSSAGLLEHGEKLYRTHCALCHGPKGRGDGSGAAGLDPPPRNFVEGKWSQGGSLKALFITLQKGVEGTSMISYRHLPKEDRWALVHYIQSVTQNKVSMDPQKLEEFGKTAL